MPTLTKNAVERVLGHLAAELALTGAEQLWRPKPRGKTCGRLLIDA
jgi:hypothetical protein